MRINPKNFEEAFVDDPVSLLVLLCSMDLKSSTCQDINYNVTMLYPFRMVDLTFSSVVCCPETVHSTAIMWSSK